MSVDSFLDSIIASTAATQQPAAQKQETPAVPVFQKPPTIGPPTMPPTLPPPPQPFHPGPAPVRIDVAVTVPADPARKAFIDLMAKFCAADGEAFEKVLFSSFSLLCLQR
jgi:hypothetical protein